MKILILFCMLFLHIVDDYYMQGILAQMKQKSWWLKNAPDDLYKNDYKIALVEHAFSWAFMIMLPFAVFTYVNNLSILPYVITFLANWIIHIIVDNLKANVKSINLITDQCIHVFQVFITWVVMMLMK